MIGGAKGIGIGLDFGIGNIKRPTKQSSLDPAIKEALCGVWIADQNTNESPTRNIIKNKLKDRGGDFEILNASYTEGSGYKDGAFVTDGVDDLIVSQKHVSDMLGGSNEITVVSMMHQIAFRTNSNDSLNNQIRPTGDNFIRNIVTAFNKTGIYGYTISNLNNSLYNNTVVNNILGDKNDYVNSFSLKSATDGLFSIEGYKRNDGYFKEVSQVAWYWTFIAKRVLTTDEINQVIAYYNLDKYVAPDIYYDVKKQGLTNENHAEFGDKLIDYSGNGKDMQLYNFGWKLDSGVGKYEEDFTSWSKYPNVIINNSSIKTNSTYNSDWLIYIRTNIKGAKSINIKITGIPQGGSVEYYYTKDTTAITPTIMTISNDGIYKLPEIFITPTNGLSAGFHLTKSNILDYTNLVIEQLPSYEGALVFDGVDDYGQYVGDLGLKDYTVVADRAYVELTYRQFPFVSNNKNDSNTPFIMEYSVDIETHTNPFSYGNRDSVAKPIDKNRKVSYQSTYVYNGNTITKGSSTNTGDGLTFSRYHINDPYTKLCLYNFMLFPYSLSEFLIERQLKKRKLGTLHPVVKFNPIIEGNEPFEILKYNKITEDNAYLDVTKGEYIPIGHEIGISIKLSDNTFKLTKVTSSALTDIIFGMPPGTPYATIIGTLTDKSPQDIEIYIENNQQGGGGEEPVIDFTTWIKGNNATMTCTPTTVHLTNMTAAGMVIETKSIDLVLPSIKVRVSGVQKGRGVAFQYNKPDGTFNLYWCETDGEHTIPSSVHTEKQQYTIIKTNFAGDCDILIEVLT